MAESSSIGVIAALSGETLAWLLPVLQEEFESVYVHRRDTQIADAPTSLATIFIVDEAHSADQELLSAVLAIAPRAVSVVAGPTSGWTTVSGQMLEVGMQPTVFLSPTDDPQSTMVRLRMLQQFAESGSKGLEAFPEQLDEERNRVVARLAGAVAHKLKQPLTVALGFLELVLDDPDLDLDPETMTFLRQTRDALDSMDDVVNRLQDATHYQTRPYAGTLEILDIDAGTEGEQGVG